MGNRCFLIFQTFKASYAAQACFFFGGGGSYVAVLFVRRAELTQGQIY